MDKETIPTVLPKDVTKLVKLMTLKSVKENAQEIERVVDALSDIAECESGCQACFKAGAHPALLALLFKISILTDDTARMSLIGALWNLSTLETIFFLFSIFLFLCYVLFWL